MAAGPQVHSRTPEPSQPHGQGLAAATSRKEAGRWSAPWTRSMVTERSSSGWRRPSTAARGNSGNSSRNRTPLWASEISPGPGRRAAADQGGGGDGVVRGAERADVDQAVGEAHRGVDLGGLEGLGAGHVGEQGRDPARDHGLAVTGWAGEKHVRLAGDDDRERARAAPHSAGLLVPPLSLHCNNVNFLQRDT
jgi:hypothetical protein